MVIPLSTYPDFPKRKTHPYWSGFLKFKFNKFIGGGGFECTKDGFSIGSTPLSCSLSAFNTSGKL